MKQTTPIIKPIFQRGLGIPDWFHHHGSKIDWIGFNDANSVRKTLLLGSSAVEIAITKDLTGLAREPDGWLLTYKINHSTQSFSSGTIWLSLEDLLTAFGFSDVYDPEYGQPIINRCGGEVAYQGRYLRYEKFLNLPGPGHANDGDPNVSIYITKKIQVAVDELIGK